MHLTQLIAKWDCHADTYLYRSGRWLSYVDSAHLIRLGTTELAGLPVANTNVGLLASGADYVLGYWMLMSSGATVVPLNPRATDHELARQVRGCDCSWVLSDANRVAKATRLAAGAGVGRLMLNDNLTIECTSHPPRRLSRRNQPDSALLMQTSGTTAAGKFVELSHAALLANSEAHCQVAHLSDADRGLVVLPVSFSYANTSQLLSHTRTGGSLVFFEEPVFSARQFCHYVERFQITVTALVPSALHILNQYRHFQRHNLSSLRLITFGGAAPAVRVVRELEQKLPRTTLMHTYGLTEAGPRVTSLAGNPDFLRMPSIGKPLPGVEIRIVSADQLLARTGEIGELQVRSPGVMSGYYGQKEATQAALTDGWLRTGDLAYQDPDGFVFLNGRLKNIIVSGGVNLSPEEIESQLLSHPAIDEVVVCGMADEALGEVPVAYVTLRSAGSLSLSQIHEHLRERLSPHKWPQRVFVRPAFDRTETGKLRRAALEGIV